MRQRRKSILFYVVGGILLGFIILTVLVSAFPVSLLDREFTEEIQEHQYPILDSYMEAISWIGSIPQSILVVLAVSIVFLLFKRKREAIFIPFTLLSGLVSRLLKILIDRPRPTEDLVRIIEKAKHQSFPSGHVLFYVTFFGFLIIVMNHLKDINRALRISVMAISALLIFTIPISRVYLGAHWFTDVLGGAMIGSLCLFILSYIYLKKSSTPS